MHAVAKIGLAVSSACLWMASVQPGTAQEMVRGYALIETEPGTEVPDALGDLMNCKGLTKSWVGSEVIAFIECNDLKSLNEAIGRMPEIAGVLQTTLLSVKRE